MAVVIDASAVAPLTLPDEQASYSEALLDYMVEHGAVAPWIWWYEVRNLLVINERRGRLTSLQAAEFLDLVTRLRVKLDNDHISRDVLTFAKEHTLTVYDAAYLELAARASAPLATLDDAMRRAAERVGVELFRPSVVGTS